MGWLIWNSKSQEKLAIICFLSKQLISKNNNGDFCGNTTVNDHNDSFHERVGFINNNFLLVQDDKKGKCKGVVVVGDSVLNNINSRGPSKSKNVSISNHSVPTSKHILSAVEETLKPIQIL